MNRGLDPQTIMLNDSRLLAWAEYGDPVGLPVFYLHGGGSCHLEGAWFHKEAAAMGLRIIAPDRLSAGLSTPATLPRRP